MTLHREQHHLDLTVYMLLKPGVIDGTPTHAHWQSIPTKKLASQGSKGTNHQTYPNPTTGRIKTKAGKNKVTERTKDMSIPHVDFQALPLAGRT